MIHFHFEDIDLNIKDLNTKKEWIKQVIDQKGSSTGELNIIFCSDKYLLSINQEHLNHNYYTDIITFDYVNEHIISGDLFISLERIKDNAENLSISFNDELDRVIIHGVLHLLGHKDKTEADKLKIRAEEDFCLTLRPLK